jgi:hypothetical protein
VDDAQYATLEAASRNDATAYGVVTSFAAGPLLSLVLSVVLFGVFRSAGTASSFQQVLAVVSHAGVILALRQVVETPLMYLRETLASPITLGLMASPLNEASPLGALPGHRSICSSSGGSWCSPSGRQPCIGVPRPGSR